MRITKFIILFNILLASTTFFGQQSIAELTKEIPKGEYAIIELRLNTEDEFRTLEGRDTQGLARIALFTGKNQNVELLFKGFDGFNQIVNILNEMKQSGFKLVETYPIEGQSLLLTHYVFEKKSK